MREPLRWAWEQLGLKFNEDGNGGEPLGFNECVENWRDRKRQCAREAYRLEGVELLLETSMHRIPVENGNGKKKALGVELLGGRRIIATEEVILSSGAIGSPNILMLSGIGPEADSNRLSTPLVLDVPGVRQNYHDHLSMRQWWKLCNPEAELAVGSLTKMAESSLSERKFLDCAACQQTPSGKLHLALEIDGSMEKNKHLPFSKCYRAETLIVHVPVGTIQSSIRIPFDGTHIASIVVGVLPTSRGATKLASADPLDTPLIDPEDYATEGDKCSMREDMRKILPLMLETSEGKAIVEDNVPAPGLKKPSLASTDEGIDTHIKQLAYTTFHPAEITAIRDIVEPDLKVVGIEGLRVVDVSVSPVPIAGHYHVPLYALAEPAADSILGS